ncbi:MAG: HlyC/CorC family transporter [Francisellaceae bacterium]
MDLSFTLISLIILILLSAFFSGSETAMMSLNKYKLRHLAKHKNKAARRSLDLIRRPDRLLGMILIGNTFANIIASAILTSYAESHFGQIGIIVATFALTITILLFAEIMPKTIAAIFPERVAFPASLMLKILLRAFYPLVWILNIIANGILRIFNIKIALHESSEALSKDEIHSVVHESKAKLGHRAKNMLIGVLELDRIKVAEVMIPHHRVEYVDLNHTPQQIITKIVEAKHTILIACYGDIENIAGVIHSKKALKFIEKNILPSPEEIHAIVSEPYFIPENISLRTQLVNFQQQGKRFAVVVNEYGEIEGIITVEDIIEEIVGEFSDSYNLNKHIKPLSETTHIATGDTTIRELNRHIHLHLPTEEAKTLSGFIMEQLEDIPIGACCIKVDTYIIEVTKVDNNTIELVKIHILR